MAEHHRMIPTLRTEPSTPMLPFSRKQRNGTIMVNALIHALEGCGWRKSKALERELGLTDRGVRSLAAASQGRVVSGNQGYCVIWEASVTDAQRGIDRLRSQGREMLKRANAQQAALNRRTV